jgi:hypothetical protein
VQREFPNTSKFGTVMTKISFKISVDKFEELSYVQGEDARKHRLYEILLTHILPLGFPEGFIVQDMKQKNSDFQFDLEWPGEANAVIGISDPVVLASFAGGEQHG